tara:strand:- start:84 stop:224 length:141 start_codon:yes stop_codon:yes gene_type:complete
MDGSKEGRGGKVSDGVELRFMVSLDQSVTRKDGVWGEMNALLLGLK